MLRKVFYDQTIRYVNFLLREFRKQTRKAKIRKSGEKTNVIRDFQIFVMVDVKNGINQIFI
jgi:hypothetical protein